MSTKEVNNDKIVNFGKVSIENECDLSDSVSSENDKEVDDPKPSFAKNSAGKRRAAVMNVDDAVPSSDFNTAMSKILESFGAHINKKLAAKRKCLEKYTQESMHATTKKIYDTSKTQLSQRKKLVEEFRRQLTSLIEQGEIQMEKAKETEEKFQKLIEKQQKQHLQVRISQDNSLKALKLLGDQFFKGMDDLESNQQQQYSSVYNDLKKEMSLLQKKFLMDAQQREMMNVRRNLMM